MTYAKPVESRRSRHAFTLVELLVVIGIIALLISILLPVLGSARESANSAACLSNQRQIAQAMFGYAAEQRDFVPYGFVFNHTGPNGRADPAYASTPAGNAFFDWVSVVEAYNDPTQNLKGLAHTGEYPKYFKCPSTGGEFDNQLWDYQPHPVAVPLVVSEVDPLLPGIHQYGSPAGKPVKEVRPATKAKMSSDFALMWDQVPNVYREDIDQIYLVENYYTAVDLQLFQVPTADSIRYKQREDPYEGVDFLDRSQSIAVFTRTAFPQSNLPLGPGQYYIENLNYPHFRHSDGTNTNVVFGDGHAEALSWSPTVTEYDDVAQSEFKRYMLQLKQ